MVDFNKLYEAIDPDMFQPASEEELQDRGEDTETYEMKVGSHVFQLVHYNESGKSELIVKDPHSGDFTLAEFSHGGVDVSDGLALLDFLQEVMQEHGEDISDE